jgi:hypothetical protein
MSVAEVCVTVKHRVRRFCCSYLGVHCKHEPCFSLAGMQYYQNMRMPFNPVAHEVPATKTGNRFRHMGFIQCRMLFAVGRVPMRAPDNP